VASAFATPKPGTPGVGRTASDHRELPGVATGGLGPETKNAREGGRVLGGRMEWGSPVTSGREKRGGLFGTRKVKKSACKKTRLIPPSKGRCGEAKKAPGPVRAGASIRTTTRIPFRLLCQNLQPRQFRGLVCPPNLGHFGQKKPACFVNKGGVSSPAFWVVFPRRVPGCSGLPANPGRGARAYRSCWARSGLGNRLGGHFT